MVWAMSIDQIEWLENPVSLTSKQVAEAEAELGIIFPDDYREFILGANLGVPLQSDFVISEARGEFIASIGTFLSLLPSDNYSIKRALEMRQDQLPKGLIPIAESGGGDYVCFDYRTEANPPLCYWYHGRLGLDDEVVYVADNLTEFIAMLREPNDEDESCLD